MGVQRYKVTTVSYEYEKSTPVIITYYVLVWVKRNLIKSVRGMDHKAMLRH